MKEVFGCGVRVKDKVISLFVWIEFSLIKREYFWVLDVGFGGVVLVVMIKPSPHWDI